MPTESARKRASRDRRRGRSASTQAGEFVKDEIDTIRRGGHGARSAKQAIAIGLNEARRAGVDLPPPKKGRASEKTRRSAELAREAGRAHPHAKPSKRRSRAATAALKREGDAAASHAALSRQAHSSARSRTAADRSEAAKKGARTKGAAAEKGARTRARHGR